MTIISRTRVGYEILDSGRGAEHCVGYHKLVSNKHEWNNCFIKYKTLDFVYVEVLNVNPCKHRDCILLLAVSNAECRGQFAYLDKLHDIGDAIYIVSREPIRFIYQKFNIQGLVFSNRCYSD